MAKAGIDVAAWTIGLYVSSWVRLDLSWNLVPGVSFVPVLALAAISQCVGGFYFGLYRLGWVYGSFEEVLALVKASVLTTVVVFGFVSSSGRRPVPRGAVLAGGLVALLAMGAARYLVRLLREHRLRMDKDNPSAVRTLVFGAGSGGEHMIRSMRRDPEGRYVPVGLVDDDSAKRRLSIEGVRVLGGRSQLAEIAKQTRAQALLVAAPSADSATIASLTEAASELKLLLKVVPPLSELFDNAPGVSDIRDVEVTDLLGRRQIDTNIQAIAGYIRGRRVLVTGAGGSIGSELCRQLHRFSPSALLMLDRDESALHAVQLSIEGRALLESPNLILSDIRDLAGLQVVFQEHRPDVVFHAAALKHLTLLENHPREAVKTNVRGSLNVLMASRDVGVDLFVNISTDKAANPSSVLGYTKRLAERLTAAVACSVHSGTYVSVRFGNVLGSRGSFIHTFRAQIESGGPVTVTDRNVTRYFMTIPESVQLVIQAGAIGRDGEVLILDMGQPIRIADVAKRMVSQSGRDIRVVYTGLRSGEKLHEELLGEGEIDDRPNHRLITQAPVPPTSFEVVDELEAIDEDREKLLDLLRALQG